MGTSKELASKRYFVSEEIYSVIEGDYGKRGLICSAQSLFEAMESAKKIAQAVMTEGKTDVYSDIGIFDRDRLVKKITVRNYGEDTECRNDVTGNQADEKEIFPEDK